MPRSTARPPAGRTGRVERMDVDERRARLARRHRLAPESRATTSLDAARAVVVLHSTGPDTVFLSTWARTTDFEVADLEHALYDERTLVRMLGMRRTLWVVPRALVAGRRRGVHADDRRAGAEAPRGIRRAERRLGRSRRLDRRGGRRRAPRGRGAGRGVHDRRRAGRAAPGDEAAPGAGTRWEVTASAASRLLPLLAADGALVRGRPRTSWTNGQYAVGCARETGSAPSSSGSNLPDAQAELLRVWLRRSGPATETDIRWWTGWTRTGGPRSAGGRTPRRGRPGRLRSASCSPTTWARPPPPEPWAALLPTLDPTTMGWKERVVPRPARLRALRRERQRRPDRLVGRTRRRRLVAARATGRSRTSSSRTSAPTPCARSRPRRNGFGRGSERSGSRPGSSRPSSARSGVRGTGSSASTLRRPLRASSAPSAASSHVISVSCFCVATSRGSSAKTSRS